MTDQSASTSEITFGTDGWRASGDDFTIKRVRAIGRAVGRLLAEDEPGPVAVGYDARRNSKKAADALAEELTAFGRDVTVSARDCPTPVLAWTVRDGPFVGGLMVTASHNPPEYNGVKYVTESGAPALPRVTDEIERQLGAGTDSDGRECGSITERDLRSAYRDHARSFVSTDLNGLAIGYDAMHGSGRDVTDSLLESAGADVTRLRCSRDPSFGGISPEPVPEYASTLVERVREGSLELGFINDGDADRLGVITPARGFLDPNVLLTVLYEYLLEQTDDPGDVVRTVSTSSLVDRVADAAGQSVHETAVGFKWVAEAMATHDALAGGEESGGYGIGTHLHNKDGVLLALVLAAAHVEQPLDDRIDTLFERYGEISQDRRSLDCPDDHKQRVLDALGDSVPGQIAGVAVEDIQTVDGFKLHLVDGSWVLVRPSGTEPKLRVYAEASAAERVQKLLSAGEKLIEPHIA